MKRIVSAADITEYCRYDGAAADDARVSVHVTPPSSPAPASSAFTHSSSTSFTSFLPAVVDLINIEHDILSLSSRYTAYVYHSPFSFIGYFAHSFFTDYFFLRISVVVVCVRAIYRPRWRHAFRPTTYADAGRRLRQRHYDIRS